MLQKRLARIVLPLATFALLALGLCAIGRATTVVALDADALTQRAQRIVHGTVLDAKSYVGESGLVVTRYVLAVHDTLKGPTRDSMVFVQPGGTYRGISTVIPGLSTHAVGDEEVMFLGPPSARGWVLPVGLDQGDFKVTLDADGVRRVRRHLHGLRMLPPQDRQVGAQFREAAPLAEFMASVRERVSRLEKRKEER